MLKITSFKEGFELTNIWTISNYFGFYQFYRLSEVLVSSFREGESLPGCLRYNNVTHIWFKSPRWIRCEICKMILKPKLKLRQCSLFNCLIVWIQINLCGKASLSEEWILIMNIFDIKELKLVQSCSRNNYTTQQQSFLGPLYVERTCNLW